MMRSAKKMLLIPEAEYLSLLSLLNAGTDPLVKEKAGIEQRIHNVLADPKTDADLKSKRRDALFKQRRAVQKKIEDKPPQRVVVENMAQLQPPSIPPYLDVGSIPVSQGKETPVSYPPSLPSLPPEPSPYRTPRTTARSSVASAPAAPVSAKVTKRKGGAVKKEAVTPTLAMPYITPDNLQALMSHVEANKAAFGIDADSGKIAASSPSKGGRQVGDYKVALERLTRPRYAPNPNGFKALYNRLESDPFFQSILVRGPAPSGTPSTTKSSKTSSSASRSNTPKTTTRGGRSQSGTGKIRGLKRVKKPIFRPVIWARL